MNKRYIRMLRLLFVKSPMKRADMMKHWGVFKSCGDRVMITSRKIPLYSRLISIGNNVWIASNVEMITHDVAHFMLNGMKIWDKKFKEKVGCISIGNNVIIGSSSLVNKDIEDNSVYAGVPARKIGDFEEFVEKRKENNPKVRVDNASSYIDSENEDLIWKIFEKSHK